MSHVAQHLVRFLTILALVSAVTCFAQFSGSIQGTVGDPSGSAITSATVTLRNTDTGVYQHATSDSSGLYRFVSLAPGPYEISATAPGFQTVKVSFALTSNETREVPMALPVAKDVLEKRHK